MNSRFLDLAAETVDGFARAGFLRCFLRLIDLLKVAAATRQW